MSSPVLSQASTTPVLVFGSEPPPFGGVSVFIKRHVSILRSEGREVTMVNWPGASFAAKLKCAARLLLNPRPIDVELHGFQTIPKLLVLLRGFGGTSTLWLHSGQFSGRLKSWRRRLLQSTLNRSTNVILVSEHIKGLLDANGYVLNRTVQVQHAFLPPVVSEEKHIWNSYAREVRDFVERSNPLMVMQGADAFHEGVDRYGTDLAIEALHLVKTEHRDIGLVVGQPSIGSVEFQEYSAQLLARIRELDLDSSVLFLRGEQELWPLTARATIFLRPSNQDGDSISVREALFLGVQVVASDACPRPAECRLFRSRDATSLAAAIRDAATVSLNAADQGTADDVD